MNRKITMAFADDCLIQHKLIEKMIKSNKVYKLIYQAYDGGGLIQQLEKTLNLPDVCLLDIEMPVMNGIQVAKHLSKSYPKIKIFGYTSSKDEAITNKMLESGTIAVFGKNETIKFFKELNMLFCSLETY